MVIKKVDKGSVTVVMEREDYISKSMSLLNNREHYRQLDEDPTDILVQDIKNVLSNMVNSRFINEEIARVSSTGGAGRKLLPNSSAFPP